MNKNYDDIINLPHYVSKKRPQMSIEARSAQFAPFAALTGYDEKVKETARLTDKKIELEDGQKEILNNKLLYLLENIDAKPESVVNKHVFQQFDLFSNNEEQEALKRKELEDEKEEKKVQEVLLNIKSKFGKNAILKGMNLEEGGTTIERNGQVGGHKG